MPLFVADVLIKNFSDKLDPLQVSEDPAPINTSSLGGSRTYRTQLRNLVEADERHYKRVNR